MSWLCVRRVDIYILIELLNFLLHFWFMANHFWKRVKSCENLRSQTCACACCSAWPWTLPYLMTLPVPLQRSLSVPAVVSTSWTSSSWRCWTDTGTPSASSAPTVRLRWRTNVSPEQEAFTAKRIFSSEFQVLCFILLLDVILLNSCSSFLSTVTKKKNTLNWLISPN